MAWGEPPGRPWTPAPQFLGMTPSPGLSSRLCPQQGPHEAGREATTGRKPPGTRGGGWAFSRDVSVPLLGTLVLFSGSPRLPGTPRTFLKQEGVGSLGPPRSPLALPHQETPLPAGLLIHPLGETARPGPAPSPVSVPGPRPASQASVPPTCLHFLEKQVKGHLFT